MENRHQKSKCKPYNRVSKAEKGIYVQGVFPALNKEDGNEMCACERKKESNFWGFKYPRMPKE